MRIWLAIVDLPDSLEPEEQKFNAGGLGGERTRLRGEPCIPS